MMASLWRERLRRALAEVRRYSHVSSLHGMRHIVKEGISFKERVFWLVLLLCLGTYMVGMCSMQWLHYRRVPTETVLTHSAVSIADEPFPLVSLCPSHQIDKSMGLRLLRRVAAFANNSLYWGMEVDKGPGGLLIPTKGAPTRPDRKSSKWRQQEQALNDALLGLHRLTTPGMSAALPILEEQYATLLALDDLNVVDFMKRVFPSCDTFFHSCLWRGIPFDCCKHFVVKPTELGYCFFFDKVEADKMVCIEAFSGRDGQIKMCQETQTLSQFGPGSGLRVFLETERDPSCVVDTSLTDSLAKLTVGSSLPSTMSAGGTVNAVPSGIYSMALSSRRTQMDASLRALAPGDRGCYLPHEWPGSSAQNRMNFPAEYSSLECMVLCRRKYVLDQCNCLVYPLTLGDPNPVCLASKMSQCITSVRDWIRFFRPPHSTPGFTAEEQKNGLACQHCLPSCDHSVYTGQLWAPELTNLPPNQSEFQVRLAQRTLVDVFYDGPNAAMLYTIVPTLSGVNLLVTFGAVANLFLGISYLTVLELFVVMLKCTWIIFVEPYVSKEELGKA